MRLTVLTLVVLALAAPAATAQDPSSPFGPLPQNAPAETPTATPPPSVEAQKETDRTLLFVIGAALLVLFVIIARVITRDARTTLRAQGRDTDAPKLREQGPHRHARESKAKARARAKAQRRARRQNR